MAITITSRFTPLTYDEITRPLIEQTQAQEMLENAYVEASDQAAQIMAQANEQTDHDSYMKLKNYSEALQKQADSLMRQGLNRNSRQSLINMRRRYGSEIVPIENAAKRRAELLEERRKAGPDYLWEKDILSLDELVRNPQADYGAYYNGAVITKRVSDAVKAAADSMVSLETTGHLTPYQIKVLEKHGYTPQEVEAAIAGGADAKSLFLQGVRDRVLGSIDVYNRGSQATKDRALGYANEGLYSAIGNQKYQLVADERAKAELAWEFQKKELDYKHQLAIQEQQAAQQQAAQAALEAQMTGIVPTNIYSEEELENIKNAGEKYSKYFTISEDGTYTLTDEGKREYDRQITTYEYPYSRTPGAKIIEQTPFRKFMNSLLPDHPDAVTGADGGDPSKYNINYTNAQLGKAFGDYINAPKKYDATKLTEYNYNINSSERDEWASIISNAVGDGATFYEANWNSKNKQYEKGKGVSVDDAFGNNGQVTAIQYSPYGITMKITDNNGKGKSKRYFLPRGINAPIEDNLISTMAGLKKAQELYHSSTTSDIIPMPKEIKKAFEKMNEEREIQGLSGIPIPASIRKEELALVAQLLESNGKFYVSQLNNTNKTTPTSWNLVGY